MMNGATHIGVAAFVDFLAKDLLLGNRRFSGGVIIGGIHRGNF